MRIGGYPEPVGAPRWLPAPHGTRIAAMRLGNVPAGPRGWLALPTFRDSPQTKSVLLCQVIPEAPIERSTGSRRS
jgi:hypothetical protein